MRHHIRLDLTVRFNSKWRIGSGEGSMLVDRLIVRDARNRPYIPGSTLKGIARESCEKLARTLKFESPSDPHQQDLRIQDSFKPLKTLLSPVDRLFGNAYQGCDLYFRNATLKEDTPYRAVNDQTRICKYRAIGTARHGHLFGSEYVAPLDFQTMLTGWHDHLQWLVEEDPPYAYCLLIAALLQVERIGGDRSTGSGEVRIIMNDIQYNGKDVSMDTVFEYLDAELYEETR